MINYSYLAIIKIAPNIKEMIKLIEIKEEIPLFFKNFLTYTETIKGKSTNTVNEYYYDLRLFLKYVSLFKQTVWNLEKLHNIDISKITIDDIKSIDLQYLHDYMSFCQNQLHNSPTTRCRKTASLKSFFKYLKLKVNLIEVNPASELESPKLKERLPKHLNVEECVELLDTVDGKFKERNYCIMTFLLNCGLRLSEIVSINIEDASNDKLTVIGKGDSERDIYLNDACIYALNDYLKVRPNFDKNISPSPLFLSERKTRIGKRMVQTIVKTYIKQAGLNNKKYTTHSCRHTAATLMFQSGVDIRTLQEVLGHKHISSTTIYTSVHNQQKKDAMSSNPLSDMKRKD